MTAKTAKKRARKHAHAERSREVPVREEGQQYARVTKMLGNGRLMAACGDGVERLCKIRGSMRRREWVRVGDVVLVALRDFQDDKADVVFRYQDAEVHRLKRLGEEVAVETRAPEDEEDDAHDLVTFEPGDDDLGDEAWERI